MKKIKTLAAAAVVAVSLFSMQGDAMAAEDNTISVRGIAKQEVAPDMAYLTLGISVKGDTLSLCALRRQKQVRKYVGLC